MNVVEAFGSGTLSKGRNPSGELRFVVTGVDMTSGFTEQSVVDAVNAVALTTFAGLPRDSTRVEQISNDVWAATVTYSRQSTGQPPTVGTTGYAWSFSTQGQTERVEMAISQTAQTLITNGTVPTNVGLQIAIDQDGVAQGVDIVVPKLEWSETHVIAASVVEGSSGAWIKTVAGITGSVNSGTFRGFAAGEVLFLGASGSKNEDSTYSVTFNFLCSNNVASLSFPTYDANGQKTNTTASIAKGGHDYIWFLHQKSEDATTKAITPITSAVFSAKVYPSASFTGVIP